MRNRVIASLASLFLAAAFSGSAGAAEALPARSSMVSGVTITVRPTRLAAPRWEFEVVLESHSADLKDDLAKSASLVADGTAATPLAWRGDPPGGHHRKGVLEFKPVTPLPAGFELAIQRTGEPVPRVFRWTLRPGR